MTPRCWPGDSLSSKTLILIGNVRGASSTIPIRFTEFDTGPIR
jgi:hypothetical protein